jgi:hypothetical protein
LSIDCNDWQDQKLAERQRTPTSPCKLYHPNARASTDAHVLQGHIPKIQTAFSHLMYGSLKSTSDVANVVRVAADPKVLVHASLDSVASAS